MIFTFCLFLLNMKAYVKELQNKVCRLEEENKSARRQLQVCASIFCDELLFLYYQFYFWSLKLQTNFLLLFMPFNEA